MRISKIKTPIVLVHGLFGFDRIQLAGLTVANYFAGIPKMLRDAGNRVYTPYLTPTGGVADRAAQLKSFINDNCPDKAVHILAHSMGGLDARYMISKLDMEDRVVSLTTLGTPHRGCSFADWGIARFERLVKPVLNTFGIPTQGIYDVTIDKCKTFNRNVPDSQRVHYFSVAGLHHGQLHNPEWLLPYYIVFQNEGPNDGVVSLASAKYGEAFDVWDGDHFSLVNWLNPLGRNRGLMRDPSERYAPLVQRMADLKA